METLFEAWTSIFLFFLWIVTLAFVCYYVDKNLKLERKAKYAEIIEKIDDGFTFIEKLIRDQPQTEIRYIHDFSILCTRIAAAFGTITGQSCGVCIKVIKRKVELNQNGINTNDLILGTLCRDMMQMDRDFNEDPDIHTVNSNDAFSATFYHLGNVRYFLCNNLLKLKIYRNTSFIRDFGTAQPFNENDSMRKKKRLWKLPYRSAIVVPICPGITSEHTNDKLIGFLSVDSQGTNIFMEEFDPALLYGIADGIYNALTQYIGILQPQLQNV